MAKLELEIDMEEGSEIAKALNGLVIRNDDAARLILEAALSETAGELAIDLENITGDTWVGGDPKYADEVEKHAQQAGELGRRLGSILRGGPRRLRAAA